MSPGTYVRTRYVILSLSVIFTLSLSLSLFSPFSKVWDVLGGGGGGGRLLHTLANHQKTVTCLALDGTATRLLAGGLDRHVKIYNLENFKVRPDQTRSDQTRR